MHQLSITLTIYYINYLLHQLSTSTIYCINNYINYLLHQLAIASTIYCINYYINYLLHQLAIASTIFCINYYINYLLHQLPITSTHVHVLLSSITGELLSNVWRHVWSSGHFCSSGKTRRSNHLTVCFRRPVNTEGLSKVQL